MDAVTRYCTEMRQVIKKIKWKHVRSILLPVCIHSLRDTESEEHKLKCQLSKTEKNIYLDNKCYQTEIDNTVHDMLTTDTVIIEKLVGIVSISRLAKCVLAPTVHSTV